MNFKPKEGLTKLKIVENMKEQSDAAEAMMPGALDNAMNTKEKEPTQDTKQEQPKPQDTKQEQPKPQTKKPTGKSLKKGGSRKKRKKYKRKTRKRALKKRN